MSAFSEMSDRLIKKLVVEDGGYKFNIKKLRKFIGLNVVTPYIVDEVRKDLIDRRAREIYNDWFFRIRFLKEF